MVEETTGVQEEGQTSEATQSEENQLMMFNKKLNSQKMKNLHQKNPPMIKVFP